MPAAHRAEVERFREVAALGASTFIMAMPYTLEERRALVRFLSEEVMPGVGG